MEPNGANTLFGDSAGEEEANRSEEHGYNGCFRGCNQHHPRKHLEAGPRAPAGRGAQGVPRLHHRHRGCGDEESLQQLLHRSPAQVVMEKDVEFTSLLPDLRIPNVSAPQPSPSMNQVHKIVSDQVSRLTSLIHKLSTKIDHTHTKSAAPTFSSYDTDDKMAIPVISTKIGSSQAQPKYGMLINSYPGQPMPPPSMLGPAPASTGIFGATIRISGATPEFLVAHVGHSDSHSMSGKTSVSSETHRSLRSTRLSGSAHLTAQYGQCVACFYYTMCYYASNFSEPQSKY